MSDFPLQPPGTLLPSAERSRGRAGVPPPPSSPSPQPCRFPVCSLLPPTGDRGFMTLSFAGTVPWDVTELRCSHFLLCFSFERGETVVASWAHFTDRVTEATAAGGKLSQGLSL